MAYTMNTRSVKQAGKQWWNEVDPTGAQRYATFVQSSAGFVSATGGVTAGDPNVWESSITFETKAQFDAFVAACKTNADWMARDAYKSENGQTSTFTFS